MVPLNEALEIVLKAVTRTEAAEVPLLDALGLVLAKDVASDMDMPPFHKSAMDGFAVIAADLATLPCTLSVVEEIPAGSVPTVTIEPGHCARIMTGAPVPDGADTVVRVEDTEPGAGLGDVIIRKAVPKDSNICFRAEDVARGDVVLRAAR